MTTIRNRRRVARGQEVGANEYLELLYGPGGDFRTSCDRCRDLERSTVLGAFDHHEHCPCSQPGPSAGFHDDDTPCLSYFASPDDREAAWEHLSAEPWFRRKVRPDEQVWARRVYG